MRISCGNLKEVDMINFVLNKLANETNHIFSCILIVLWMRVFPFISNIHKKTSGCLKFTEINNAVSTCTNSTNIFGSTKQKEFCLMIFHGQKTLHNFYLEKGGN